jgi:hypothetical protein
MDLEMRVAGGINRHERSDCVQASKAARLMHLDTMLSHLASVISGFDLGS